MSEPMMNHIAFDGFGGPEVMKMTRSPRPEPGPGEVLIRVAYAGVNRPDIVQRCGAYPPPPGVTGIPGLEVSGEVVGAGQGATAFRTGDQVCALVAGGATRNMSPSRKFRCCGCREACPSPLPRRCPRASSLSIPTSTTRRPCGLARRG